jgi:hypothetical protein
VKDGGSQRDISRVGETNAGTRSIVAHDWTDNQDFCTNRSEEIFSATKKRQNKHFIQRILDLLKKILTLKNTLDGFKNRYFTGAEEISQKKCDFLLQTIRYMAIVYTMKVTNICDRLLFED